MTENPGDYFADRVAAENAGIVQQIANHADALMTAANVGPAARPGLYRAAAARLAEMAADPRKTTAYAPPDLMKKLLSDTGPDVVLIDAAPDWLLSTTDVPDFPRPAKEGEGDE